MLGEGEGWGKVGERKERKVGHLSCPSSSLHGGMGAGR